MENNLQKSKLNFETLQITQKLTKIVKYVKIYFMQTSIQRVHEPIPLLLFAKGLLVESQIHDRSEFIFQQLYIIAKKEAIGNE